MNGGATTAFLPNFAGFPSPPGTPQLNCSTSPGNLRTVPAQRTIPGAYGALSVTRCSRRPPHTYGPRGPAAPCQPPPCGPYVSWWRGQLPPPHPPPPPQEDPPPQELPLPHEDPPPQECPWCPPELPELPDEQEYPLTAPPPPAHQLLLLLERPDRPFLSDVFPLRTLPEPPADDTATTMPTITSPKMMAPMITPSPSSHSPENAPVGRDSGIPGPVPRQSRVEELLRVFQGEAPPPPAEPVVMALLPSPPLYPPAPSAVIVAVTFAGRVKLSGAPVKVNVRVRPTARGAFAPAAAAAAAAAAAPAVVAAAPAGSSTSPASASAMHRTVAVPTPHHRLPPPNAARLRPGGAVTGSCCAFSLLTDVSDSVSGCPGVGV